MAVEYSHELDNTISLPVITVPDSQISSKDVCAAQHLLVPDYDRIRR